MGTDSTIHELVKNLLQEAYIHLGSLLLPTPRRREACSLWMPFGASHLCPYPGPMTVHQHNWSVSYSAYNYLLYNQVKL